MINELCSYRRVGLLTFLFIFVPWSAVAQITAAGRAQLSEKGAQKVIKDWEGENTDLVVLEKPAAKKVEDALTAGKGMTSIHLSNTLTESQNDFIVSSYLYELRDRKYEQMGSPSLSEAFKVNLTSKDVDAFPVERYLAGLGPDLLRRPGELSVESTPPGASVSIDGTARGITPKAFVVSRGGHQIVVKLKKRSCQDTIDVQDFYAYKCPTK